MAYLHHLGRPEGRARLTGHVLGSMIQTTLSLAIVIGVALVVGFRPTARQVEWVSAIGLLVLVTLALTWLSVAFGPISKSVETASSLPMFLLLLPSPGSGFVPTDSMSPSEFSKAFATPLIQAGEIRPRRIEPRQIGFRRELLAGGDVVIPRRREGLLHRFPIRRKPSLTCGPPCRAEPRGRSAREIRHAGVLPSARQTDGRVDRGSRTADPGDADREERRPNGGCFVASARTTPDPCGRIGVHSRRDPDGQNPPRSQVSRALTHPGQSRVGAPLRRAASRARWALRGPHHVVGRADATNHPTTFCGPSIAMSTAGGDPKPTSGATLGAARGNLG